MPQPQSPPDPGSVGTTTNGRYIPAPAKQNPGEPAEVPPEITMTPAELLPSEPGYVPPAD